MYTSLQKMMTRVEALPVEHWAVHRMMRSLGTDKLDDLKLPLSSVLDVCGFKEAVFYLSTVEGQARAIRLFAVACARMCMDGVQDSHAMATLDAAERYANGKISVEDLGAVAEDALAVHRRWVTSPDAPVDCNTLRGLNLAVLAANKDAAWAAQAVCEQSVQGLTPQQREAVVYSQKTELMCVLAAVEASKDPYPQLRQLA